MEIIPVIDVMGGVVVRARMGQRDQYRPIATPLAPTSDPVDVARGLLSVHPFRTLYIADLDAIAGREDNRAALIRLKGEFPRLTLWVDNGIGDRGSIDESMLRRSHLQSTASILEQKGNRSIIAMLASSHLSHVRLKDGLGNWWIVQ